MYLAAYVFKQKTAYEMRISDWSSDVCSSDLHTLPISRIHIRSVLNQALYGSDHATFSSEHQGCLVVLFRGYIGKIHQVAQVRSEIGRASCRGRVCQYV